MVVWTGHLIPEKVSYEFDGPGHSRYKQSWYPTVYFYDLKAQKMAWEVLGADQFVAIRNKTCTFLRNEIWSKLNRKQYQKLKKEHGTHFTRHKEFHSYFDLIKFGAKCSEDDL